jgi:hypothetical protein
VPRELDTKMPKSADTLYSDEISAAQAGVSKRVVGRDARAEQRGGFCRTQLVGNGSEGACFGNHHFRISTIRGYSGYHRVLTIDDVSSPARFADAVFAGNEADTDSLADFPSGNSAAQGVNAANDFMSGNARQFQTRVDAGDRGGIGVTDPACFHPNPNLTRSRLRDLPFHYSKHAGCGDFHRFVCIFHLWVLSVASAL